MVATHKSFHAAVPVRQEAKPRGEVANFPATLLDRTSFLRDSPRVAGGVLVSTMKTRQRRHAEDGSLAS